MRSVFSPPYLRSSSLNMTRTGYYPGCLPVSDISVNSFPLILYSFSLLLVEYVASTATGRDARKAIARKDKTALPIPVRAFTVTMQTLPDLRR
jgi:hypothetical protein